MNLKPPTIITCVQHKLIKNEMLILHVNVEPMQLFNLYIHFRFCFGYKTHLHDTCALSIVFKYEICNLILFLG